MQSEIIEIPNTEHSKFSGDVKVGNLLHLRVVNLKCTGAIECFQVYERP